MYKPEKGVIAVCSQGFKGLITSDEKVKVTYPDGTKGLAWVGYHLGPANIGMPWSSRNPRIIHPTSRLTYLNLMSMLRRVQRLKKLEVAA